MSSWWVISFQLHPSSCALIWSSLLLCDIHLLIHASISDCTPSTVLSSIHALNFASRIYFLKTDSFVCLTNFSTFLDEGKAAAVSKLQALLSSRHFLFFILWWLLWWNPVLITIHFNETYLPLSFYLILSGYHIQILIWTSSRKYSVGEFILHCASKLLLPLPLLLLSFSFSCIYWDFTLSDKFITVISNYKPILRVPINI